MVTLDLSGMAELKPGYSGYYLCVMDNDGDVYIEFKTTNYDLFSEFLSNETTINDVDYYESRIVKNEFCLEIYVL